MLFVLYVVARCGFFLSGVQFDVVIIAWEIWNWFLCVSLVCCMYTVCHGLLLFILLVAHVL